MSLPSTLSLTPIQVPLIGPILIPVPPSPSVDHQWQTFPSNPNPHPPHTSHFTGMALVAQSAGGQVGITSYPSQEFQNSNFTRAECFVRPFRPPTSKTSMCNRPRYLHLIIFILRNHIFHNFNVDHRDLRSHYIAAEGDLWAEGVPEINANAIGHHATSDLAIKSNDDHTAAGSVVVPNGTNIDNAGNSSGNSANLQESLPNISKNVPNKKRHGILPFTPPEQRNTETYISTSAPKMADCSSDASGKDVVDCPFGNMPKRVIMSIIISSRGVTNVLVVLILPPNRLLKGIAASRPIHMNVPVARRHSLEKIVPRFIKRNAREN
ncbi:hypothetical protein M422DRAFT_243647 [Sphaerobolus stellatus SS14]|nr:hypothetical protein M422DRAFT_243647 [Sphaerobolus stellatus SS14]